MVLLFNGKLYTKDGFINNAYLIYKKGKIVDIGDCSSFKEDKSDYEVIDVNGAYIFPGFIDIHVNGGGGSMFMDANEASIQKILYAHAKHGVTSVLATTITGEPSLLEKALSEVIAYAKKEKKEMGANLIGIHLEGPFINPQKAGAHNKKYIRTPKSSELQTLIDASEGFIKLVSYAPEIDGDNDFLEFILQKRIRAGLAHSMASCDEASYAIKKGLSLGTHLFNAMPQIESRNPGPIVAFLNSEHTYVELIGDGKHVSFPILEMVSKLKRDKTIIVTDAVTPAGTTDKTFEMDGMPLSVNEYSCYLSNGTLAGSALTLDYAVALIAKNTKLDLETIINMVTKNPAEFLGIDNCKGSLAVGFDADIVIMDKSYKVLKTIIGGKKLS